MLSEINELNKNAKYTKKIIENKNKQVKNQEIELKKTNLSIQKIARELNVQTDLFPPDPRDWNQEQIGRYLVANGDDLPGNLKIGRMALDRVRKPPQKSRHEDYPELADKAVDGEVYGSSAGGEHAKFATYSRERDAHVIVKFSPKGNGELATRWRDILVTEYIASEVLHDHHIPAAELEIFEESQVKLVKKSKARVTIQNYPLN